MVNGRAPSGGADLSRSEPSGLSREGGREYPVFGIHDARKTHLAHVGFGSRLCENYFLEIETKF